MIRVTPTILVPMDEIEERFIRSPGPGGQNVNKVETAVQLRFDALASPSLPEYVKEKLKQIGGQRLTKEGVIVITSSRTRSQERNRADALDRLTDLLREAAHRTKTRRATRPTLASKKRRLEGKKQRAQVKAGRGKVRNFD